MLETDTPKNITPERLKLRLNDADNAPQALSLLNELRYITIPQTLQSRKADGDAFLEKTELVSLVEWKL